jgi:CubicO group peptidase (beta-lactamase class C family)
MQSAVLAPLGMARSSFEWTPALQAVTATAYREPGQPLSNYRFTALAAAGLYSTASDLARFVAAGMAGPNREPPGRGLLSPRDVELMFTPTVEMDASTSLGYGLGYGVRLLPGEIRMVSHSGGNRGWRARFAALPDRGEGIVILTNSDTGDGLTNDLLRFWSLWVARPAPESDQSLGSEPGEEKQ